MAADLRVYNQTRERLLISKGGAALNSWSRLRGLLGHPLLHFGQGLLIAPCNWIHTLGMGCPIDVLYLDRKGQVLRVASEMRPNRIGPLVSRASSVVELPVGAIEHTGTRAGDRLEITWTLDGKGNGL
jgi:uncharacterized membrane protein (UPF0127 family)